MEGLKVEYRLFAAQSLFMLCELVLGSAVIRPPSELSVSHPALDNFVEMRDRVGDKHFLLLNKFTSHAILTV